MGRIAQTTIAAAAGLDNTVVFDQIISAAVFPRLSRISSAYQRYRFTSLEFQVQPMCPSTTGGGYIAGFLKDPTDADTSFDAIQGSFGPAVAKWWEHKTVHVRPPADLLWTSLGENIRLASPGKFVLTNVGTNTDIVNVSVLCKWVAELSVPSLERDDHEVEIITDMQLAESDLMGSTNKIPVDRMFTQRLGTVTNGTIFRTPIPFFIDYKLGSGDVTKASYIHLQYRFASQDFLWGYCDENQNPVVFNAGADYFSDGQPEQIVIPKGTVFTTVFAG